MLSQFSFFLVQVKLFDSVEGVSGSWLVEKIIGVIGGIGPDATHDFFGKILAATPVGKEQDHIQLIIHNNTKVPDRNQSIAGTGISCAPALVSIAQNLERAGAEVLVMPCNTAHAYADDITAAVSIPLLNIVAETCRSLKALDRSITKVGVLASNGCRQAMLYDAELEQHGIECINLTENDQCLCMETIYNVKRQVDLVSAQESMESLAQSLFDRGAQVIISGCTEIPLVLEAENKPYILLDSTQVLVERCIAVAKFNAPV